MVVRQGERRDRGVHDECPHRGAPLSLGRLEGDDLVCAYHGWRFGPGGAATCIPALGTDAPIPSRARLSGRRDVRAVRHRVGGAGASAIIDRRMAGRRRRRARRVPSARSHERGASRLPDRQPPRRQPLPVPPPFAQHQEPDDRRAGDRRSARRSASRRFNARLPMTMCRPRAGCVTPSLHRSPSCCAARSPTGRCANRSSRRSSRSTSVGPVCSSSSASRDRPGGAQRVARRGGDRATGRRVDDCCVAAHRHAGGCGAPDLHVRSDGNAILYRRVMRDLLGDVRRIDAGVSPARTNGSSVPGAGVRSWSPVVDPPSRARRGGSRQAKPSSTCGSRHPVRRTTACRTHRLAHSPGGSRSRTARCAGTWSWTPKGLRRAPIGLRPPACTWTQTIRC